MKLQVLLVEDDPGDLEQLREALTSFFEDTRVPADVHPCKTFDEAYALIKDPSRRFDLVVSDTYKGDVKKGDAAVMSMVAQYQCGRFCPLVVYSSSVMPAELQEGPFLVWADKTPADGIKTAIKQLLDTGIPQLARALHEELDKTAGSYLWEFLEKKWGQLQSHGFDSKVYERLIRRRAAVQIVSEGGQQAAVSEADGVEFYLYPPLDPKRHCLGEVIRNKEDINDIRLILTPHCHLAIQPGKDAPRAEHVTTVRTRSVGDVVDKDELEKAASADTAKKHERLRKWARVPSRDVGTPEGRYWYLPGFLDIPHLYCDFQLVESITYAELLEEWEPLAVLAPPFAESLQACFAGYYSSVGLPDIRPASIEGLLG